MVWSKKWVRRSRYSEIPKVKKPKHSFQPVSSISFNVKKVERNFFRSASPYLFLFSFLKNLRSGNRYKDIAKFAFFLWQSKYLCKEQMQKGKPCSRMGWLTARRRRRFFISFFLLYTTCCVLSMHFFTIFRGFAKNYFFTIPFLGRIVMVGSSTGNTKTHRIIYKNTKKAWHIQFLGI